MSYTSMMKWRAGNPEKRAAHQAVFVAVRSGKLKKKPCKICGIEKVEAHHTDYSRPLMVIWFCKKHHVWFHQQTKVIPSDPILTATSPSPTLGKVMAITKIKNHKMGSPNTASKKEQMHRVNTRILASQDAYIKSEAKKSKGELTEGDVHRALLAEAISNRKAKK